MKALFLDFDGVVVDSDKIKDAAFPVALNGYSKSVIDGFKEYHHRSTG
jgi:beta-phosphoglucomutase-like phosphatase (HAD superfamily)